MKIIACARGKTAMNRAETAHTAPGAGAASGTLNIERGREWQYWWKCVFTRVQLLVPLPKMIFELCLMAIEGDAARRLRAECDSDGYDASCSDSAPMCKDGQCVSCGDYD